MFPLHQGNELCFKISSNNTHQSDKIPQDLILDYPELLYACTDVINNNNNNNNVDAKSLRRKSISMDSYNDENTTLRNDSKKKLIHRDIERQRRQEMSTLYASLRSLLPLEYIKGKRSTSDHISESVNYIKYLRKRIKELDAKRNELKQKISLRDIPSENSTGSSSICSQNPGILIRPCLSGLEIVFGTGLREQERCLTLSRVLQVLLDAEISVVNCVSTKVNERIFHTIQTEVKDPSCLNLSELHQKLTQS